MPRAPRVLVLSASVGAGHLRAAEGVTLALRQLAPEATIKSVDVLTLTSALFRRIYAKAYLDLVNVAPHLLGFIYDATDKARAPTKLGDRLRRVTQRINLSKIIGLLEQDWDLVVNTHFLPAQIIALRRRRKRTALRHVTVVTDFDSHAFWVNEPTDRYFVATEEAAHSLQYWGVPRSTIDITGIPIHPVFATRKAAAVCRAKHGLDAMLHTVLLLAGGFGVGPIEEVYRALLAIETPVQVVAVSGRNAKLKARLEGVPVPGRHRGKVLGFTTEIDELMAASDLVLSKPGGLTTSEILARGCAMAIMNAIPGQESLNALYLLERGAAIAINSVGAVSWKVGALLADPARLAQIRGAAAELGHPSASFDIGRQVLELVSGDRLP